MRSALVLGLAALLVSATPCLADDNEFEIYEDDDAGVIGKVAESASEPSEPSDLPDYIPPAPKDVFFYSTFSAKSLQKSGWQASQDDKFKDGKWTLGLGDDKHPHIRNEQGLVVGAEAKHHAISAVLEKPFKMSEQKDLVFSYEVRFHKPHNCGGAYVKLVRAAEGFSPASFRDNTEYSIMFGPDKCGTTDKVHFIFRHKNPVSGKFEEKHLKAAPPGNFNTDTHVYTLVVKRDNTFAINVDQKEVISGSLLDNFEPPVNPPKEIDDPEDKKPADWVDEKQIKDPSASKPEDWDEEAPRTIDDPDAKKPEPWDADAPLHIPDPEAAKPSDWNDEDDGEWEAPLVDNPICGKNGCGEWKAPQIPNPKYKGKWHHPMIDNPAYKGEWKPKKIANPNFFETKTPAAEIEPIGAVGFEIWTMQDQIEFDNVILDSDLGRVNAFIGATWGQKHKVEMAVKEARDKEAASERSLFAEDSLLNQAREVFQDYPIPFVFGLGASILGLGYLLYVAFCGSSAPAPAPKTTKPADQEQKNGDAPAAEEEKEEEEGSGDENEEPKKDK